MRAGMIAVGMLALANLAGLYALSQQIDQLDSAVHELRRAIDDVSEEAAAARTAAEAAQAKLNAF